MNSDGAADGRPRAIAINVGANTNLPGIRGPVFPDGGFSYVPIPERAATGGSVPTYADLDVDLGAGAAVPADARDRPVHLDPEFPDYPGGEAYTYGDEHGVKAGPLSRLDPGDRLYFYATLDARRRTDPAGRQPSGDAPAPTADAEDPTPDARDWIVDGWGAYLIAVFEVETVLTGDAWSDCDSATRERFANNAHVKRDPFDAAVLVAGGPGSRLFDRAVPLSAPDAGTTANRVVTALSNDSGRGPWWRRRLWFDADATAELRDIVADRPFETDPAVLSVGSG